MLQDSTHNFAVKRICEWITAYCAGIRKKRFMSSFWYNSNKYARKGACKSSQRYYWLDYVDCKITFWSHPTWIILSVLVRFFFLNMQIRRQKKKTDGVSCPYVIENETFQAFDPIVLLFVLQTKCTNWRKTRNKSSRNQTTGWETGDGSRIFVHVELLCIHILQSDCVMCMRVCRIYFTIVIFSTRPRFIPLIFPSLKWINRK